VANDFCRFLSNGYRIKSTGTTLTYAPCCWFKKEISIINNPDFDAQKAEISSINNWVPECSTCQQIEESGVYGERSPRLRSFDEIKNAVIPTDVPGWMEVTIDTTCNAACIMCASHHSTTWLRQEIKLGIKSQKIYDELVDPLEWFKIIKNKFSFNYIKSISFLGGEPFESKVPIEFLKELKNVQGGLGEIRVHFQTNGSIRPSNELIALLAEVKIIYYSVSLDAIGQKFEYIRYPLKWARVEDTLNYVQNLDLPRLKMTFLPTLNPLNAYYYDDVEQWIESNILKLKLVKFDAKRATVPNRARGMLDLAKTPIKLREAILEKYGKSHVVSKMFSNLEIDNHTFLMLNYLEKLDIQRNNNYREIFPEMIPFLENKQ
jgi:molybdenum cofactor biosynthesis enzyme MoaA